MSGIKNDPYIFQDVLIIDKNNLNDPTVYAQAFSPEFPDVVSVGPSFQKTDNAYVTQQDDLAGYYSPPPELPKDQTDYKKILFYVVGGSLAFFIYNKYLRRK